MPTDVSTAAAEARVAADAASAGSASSTSADLIGSASAGPASTAATAAASEAATGSASLSAAERLARVRDRVHIPSPTTGFTGAWGRLPWSRAARELVQMGLLRPLVHSQIKAVTLGRDALPANHRPVIFVANHSSHLDTPMILLSLPDSYRRRTAVAAAADYFFDTRWRAFVSSLVFNTFPVERKAGGLTDLPGTLLRNGWSMVVYPEGTRSPDGWMTRFRMGAAWLAVEHQVPVVPIALRGSFAAMPRGSRWPRPGRPEVRLRFGPAVEPAEGETIRQFAPRVQAAVAALLDEDATTWWGAQQRAAAGTTPDPTGPKKAAQWRRLWEQAGAPTKAPSRLQAWRGRSGRR